MIVALLLPRYLDHHALNLWMCWYGSMVIGRCPSLHHPNMASLQFFQPQSKSQCQKYGTFYRTSASISSIFHKNMNLLSRKNLWKTLKNCIPRGLDWVGSQRPFARPPLATADRRTVAETPRSDGMSDQVHQKIQNSPGSGLIRVGFFDPADPGLDSFTLGKTLRSVQRKYFQ